MSTQAIRIRVIHPLTDKERIYDYRTHSIPLVPRDPLARYELVIEVLKGDQDAPFRERVSLISKKKGTKEEMEELWHTAYQRSIDCLYTRGIIFEEEV